MDDFGSFDPMMPSQEVAITGLFGESGLSLTVHSQSVTWQTIGSDLHAAQEASSNRFELLENHPPNPNSVAEEVLPNQTNDDKQKKVYSTRKPRAPFKRHNKRPVTEGNNDAGKKGKKRCDLCRKRHLRCVFTSEDSPCNLCREVGSEKPCIKMWGPKTSETIHRSTQRVSMFEASEIVLETNERSVAGSNHGSSLTENAIVPYASLDLSRPVTVYDPSIDPMDVHILQSGFEAMKNSPVLSDRLILKFTLIYGSSISHPSLHHAIVLFVSQHYPKIFPDYKQISLQLEQRARCALGRRLSRWQHDILDEGDLFAAYFIAMHFALGYANSEDTPKYIKGFLALAKRLRTPGAAIKSTFLIFSGMLIWTLTNFSCNRLLRPDDVLDLTPSHYQQWSEALGIPRSEGMQYFELARCYLLSLRAIYLPSEIPLCYHSRARMIENIRGNLNAVDETHGLSNFNFFLDEQMDPQSLYYSRRPGAAAWFDLLAHYYVCQLVLSALPPLAVDLNLRFDAALRFFIFFHNVENTIDQLELRWVSEIDILSDPESVTQDSADPLLSEAQSQLAHVRNCKLWITYYFCDYHEKFDVVRPLLSDIIDRIPVRRQDGRVGWLTEAFLNQFGWDILAGVNYSISIRHVSLSEGRKDMELIHFGVCLEFTQIAGES